MTPTARARRLAAACAGALTLAAVVGVVGRPPTVTFAGDPYSGRTGTAQLASDVLVGLGNATLVGPVAPSRVLTVDVVLSRPDPAGENAYLARVYNPRSPGFRDFLNTDGFQARFGVSQARYDATLAWLRGAGLSVTPIAGSTETVLASGTAAAVQALFSVQLEEYTFRGASFYANTAAPTVPVGLGILTVAGLEDLTRMRTMQQIHAAAIAAGTEPATVASTSVPAVIGPNTNIGSSTPQDLWSIYDMPSTDFGQGESIAIFGSGCTEPKGSPLDVNDPRNTASCANTDLIGTLRKNEATYGLPQVPIVINHYGTAAEPITDSGGTGEWTLDMAASTGMAPKVDVEHLYFGDNGDDPDTLAAYSAWVHDATGPRQGNSSFGGCEASPLTGGLTGGPANPTPGTGGVIIGNPNQDGYEAILKEAVALGRTMFVSAGDLGANGCPSNVNTALNGVTPSGTPLNTYPASSNWVTTVGGTVLYYDGKCPAGLAPCTAATRTLEYSWTHTGGGTSLFISAPPWQQDAAPPAVPAFDTNLTSAPGVTYPCTTNSEAPTSPASAMYPPGTFCRGLPDVSAQSGDVISNGYFAGGGTSLSSPLWSGMWARIQAASPRAGRIGFASPAIYANNATAANYERDFFDVGGVSPAYNPGVPNGQTVASCSVNTYFPQYNCSGSGWDFLSGWGSPDVKNLTRDLNGGNTSPVAPGSGAGPTPSPTVTPAPVTASAPAGLANTGSSGPAGWPFLLPLAFGMAVTVGRRGRIRNPASRPRRRTAVPSPSGTGGTAEEAQEPGVRSRSTG